jgi:dTDP-4-amino-4,6-dideoxygalactose transaminase
MAHIPFNFPVVGERELDYVRQAIANRHLSGNGPFTARCHAWLQESLGVHKTLLTHSCTAALEMAAILAEIEPGDEVIMPSFTFVSTANAFVLRGGVPIFVDIRQDTCNIDESLIETAITPRTKAIVVVHYAGVACDMAPILEIAARHSLLVIEDAAQGIESSYRGRPLGSLGHLAAISFHETKNVIAGEGGALIVGDARWADRSEIIWEKGTNRTQFFRGLVDKYTWVDVGSSYLPSELSAAVLLAQLEQAEAITARRLRVWQAYHRAFEELEGEGILRRPIVPDDCGHNGHLYYVLFKEATCRDAVQAFIRHEGIDAVSHYVPLHSSPGGRKFARAAGPLPVTERTAGRLLRLPLWPAMTDDEVLSVSDSVARAAALEYST